MWTASDHLTTNAGPCREWSKMRKLIFFICIVGFGYQVYRITRRYYRYDTVVQRVERRLDSDHHKTLDLPAITLCTGGDVAYFKQDLYRNFPGIKQRLVEVDAKYNDTTDSTAADREKEQEYKRTAEGLDYRGYFEHSVKADDVALCWLRVPTDDMRQHKSHLGHTCDVVAQVLDSRRPPYGKCFTYFSRQDSAFKFMADLRVRSEDIPPTGAYNPSLVMIAVFGDRLSDGIHGGLQELSDRIRTDQQRDDRRVYAFIHDGRQRPTYDRTDAVPLTPGKAYDMRFWSVGTRRLRAPFRDRCHDYDNSPMDRDEPKSRDQCWQQCYVKTSQIISRCMVVKSPLVNDHTVRSYGVRQCYNPTDYFDGKTLQEAVKQAADNQNAHRIARHCDKKCAIECRHREYRFDVRESDHHYAPMVEEDSKFTLKNFSVIRLAYKPGYDYEYRHVPVRKMCDTITEILITMLIWFGLSIFSFSSVLELTTRRARLPTLPYAIPYFNDRVDPHVIHVHPLPPQGAPPSYQSTTMGAINSSTTGGDAKSGTGMTGVGVVSTVEPVVKPKYSPTSIGSNVKLDHYNEFIEKVYQGCPPEAVAVTGAAHVVQLPLKKC